MDAIHPSDGAHGGDSWHTLGVGIVKLVGNGAVSRPLVKGHAWVRSGSGRDVGVSPVWVSEGLAAGAGGDTGCHGGNDGSGEYPAHLARLPLFCPKLTIVKSIWRKQ